MSYSPPGSSVHGILQARILEWVAMPSSRGSSQPGDWTWIFSTAGKFFTIWATGKPMDYILHQYLGENYSSIQSPSHVWLFVTPWTAARQSSLSITNSWVCSNSCPWSRWCNPTISSSVVPFSSCLQSFPASGSFPVSQFFTPGGQSIGVSASTSLLPMNIRDWFPLGWICWISLQSKGLSRVFSNTPVQKHQFFSTQISLQSSSHIHTWLLEKS